MELDGNSGISAMAQPFLDYFAEMGARIDADEEFSERYNIDFAVSRIKGLHAAVNFGVHFTHHTDQYEEQEVMVEAARLGVVSKCVFVELCSESCDTGVIPVTFAACLAFVFDRRYQHSKAIGLRIFEDSTFHYFDLEENVRRLRKDQHDSANEIEESLEGTIIAYFCEKGFGFIEEENNQKFFFHIANVADEHLRYSLPSYVQGESISVRFTYGGSEGKKYPKAIEVKAVAPAA